MRQWILIAPVLLLAACSRSTGPQAAAPPNPNTAAVAQPYPAQANPEPVAQPSAPGYAAGSSAVVVASQPYPSQPQQQPMEPADAPPPDQPAPPEAAPYTEPAQTPVATYAVARQRRELFLPAGTHFRVRIDHEIDTRRNRAGDRFSATLYEPVVVEGATMLPTGTRFHGHIVEAKPSGRFKGRAVLGLTLDSFSFDGREYRIDTSGAYRESGNHKRRNLAFIGGGSGVGAAIGAIAGGGTGAAIGAVAGGGAGVAGAAITGKKEVAVPAESPVTFTLRTAVRI